MRIEYKCGLCEGKGFFNDLEPFKERMYKKVYQL